MRVKVKVLVEYKLSINLFYLLRGAFDLYFTAQIRILSFLIEKVGIFLVKGMMVWVEVVW